MYSILIRYKVYLNLAIIFFLVRLSTQKLDVVPENVEYGQYGMQPKEGYEKLDLKQFYNSKFNLEFVRLPTNFDMGEATWLENQNKKTELWCDNYFMSWAEFKRNIDAGYIKHYAKYLKSDLDSTIVDKMKPCFDTNIKEIKPKPNSPNNTENLKKSRSGLSLMKKLGRSSSYEADLKIDEKKLNKCINDTLNDSERTSLTTNAHIFEDRMYYITEEILIDEITLKAIYLAVGNHSKQSYKDLIKELFLIYTFGGAYSEPIGLKDRIFSTALAEGKASNEKLNCIDLHYDEYEKETMANKLNKCFGNKTEKFIKCTNQYSNSVYAYQESKDTIKTCLNDGCDDQEKIQINKCINNFEMDMYGKLTVKTTPIAEINISCSTLADMITILKFKPFEGPLKCQCKSIGPFKDSLDRLRKCIGERTRTTVGECISENKSEEKNNKTLNDTLFFKQKPLLLKCANKYESKVTLNRSSIKGRTTSIPFNQIKSPATKRLQSNKSSRQFYKPNNNIEIEDYKNTNQKLHSSLIRVMFKIIYSEEDRYSKLDVFNEYAGLKAVYTTVEDRNLCKTKTRWNNTIDMRLIRASWTYLHLPNNGETHEEYIERINGLNLPYDEQHNAEYKAWLSEGNNFKDKPDEFGMKNLTDVQMGQLYETYMMNFKKNIPGYFPLGRDQWHDEYMDLYGFKTID